MKRKDESTHANDLDDMRERYGDRLGKMEEQKIENIEQFLEEVRKLRERTASHLLTDEELRAMKDFGRP
jgi:uncharacterized protein YicC (UPF0701 family)